MNKHVMLNITAEMLHKKKHQAYVLYKINEHLKYYGVDTLPGMLAILYNDDSGIYQTEAVRVYPNYVEKMINGFDEYVAAYSYYHRMMFVKSTDDEDVLNEINTEDSNETRSKVSIYYEDNLVKMTSYYDVVIGLHGEVLDRKPFEVAYNEPHPAMINMSNLYSIN